MTKDTLVLNFLSESNHIEGINRPVHDTELEMALTFLESFSTDGQAAGCAAVHAYAAQHESQILEPLGSDVYGYFNPDYSAEDICP